MARPGVREWLRDLKVFRRCADCGENHPAVLDFHHRDEDFKTDSISNMVNNAISLHIIALEVDKCDVLCANCHRKRHYETDYAYKSGY